MSRRGGPRGPSYPRGPRDEDSSIYDSRPSSRAADYRGNPYGGGHDPYMGYPRGGYPMHPHHHMVMAPQQHLQPAAAPVPMQTLDQDKLNIFRRNWEYYSGNPKAMDDLRLKNPQKHANLMRYYQMYSHLLPTAAPPPVMTESDRPSRCASVNSSVAAAAANNAGVATEANISQIQTDTTDHTTKHASEATEFDFGQGEIPTINPDPGALDPYQPTLEGSAFSPYRYGLTGCNLYGDIKEVEVKNNPGDFLACRKFKQGIFGPKN